MNKRLVEFDYLRGLSIALIVLGHSIFLWLDGFPLVLENLLRGGTGLFVFISGFFFHRVFMQKFAYVDFLVRKLQLIFIPFVFISLVALSLRCIGWFWYGHSAETVLLNCWYTVRNGFVLYPHWYIPFILLTFALSPLHIKYARLNPYLQLVLLLLFSLVAIFMHRPDSNINVLQSVIYFTPFYLLGILFSCYSDLLRLWRTWLFNLSLLVVAMAVYLQSYVFVHIGNYHDHAFTYAGVDLQFIQMLFGCLVMLELSYRIKPGAFADHLCFLANLSFPIFFIHPLFTMGIENIMDLPLAAEWVKSKSLLAALTGTGLIFIIQLYGSVAVILLARHYIGQRSRWLIGG
jgi:peptidoglycan/LPS O-acetylase OafA/YrhL